MYSMNTFCECLLCIWTSEKTIYYLKAKKGNYIIHTIVKVERNNETELRYNGTHVELLWGRKQQLTFRNLEDIQNFLRNWTSHICSIQTIFRKIQKYKLISEIKVLELIISLNFSLNVPQVPQNHRFTIEFPPVCSYLTHALFVFARDKMHPSD